MSEIVKDINRVSKRLDIDSVEVLSMALDTVDSLKVVKTVDVTYLGRINMRVRVFCNDVDKYTHSEGLGLSMIKARLGDDTGLSDDLMTSYRIKGRNALKA